jgi:hypothetical protein
MIWVSAHRDPPGPRVIRIHRRLSGPRALGWAVAGAAALVTTILASGCVHSAEPGTTLADPGFFVEFRNASQEWIVVASDRDRDFALGPGNIQRIAWLGSKQAPDGNGDAKAAHVEAYRLIGSPPREPYEVRGQRGDMLFCREPSYKELGSSAWRIEIVPGRFECAASKTIGQG